MKKVIILLSLISLFNRVNSQPSILVTDLANSNTVAPNAVILESTTPNSTTSRIFDIKNNSNATKSYDVKRYDVFLNSNATSTADAHFCFAGSCYGSGVITSITSITLSPGQSASQIQGSFNTLTTDLDEASTAGYSLIKYTIINTANTGDSIQFSIKYNNPSGLHELSNMLTPKIDVFPNPVKECFFIKLNSFKNEESEIKIFNFLGNEVFKQDLILIEGNNTIPVTINDLSGGVYFINLQTKTNSATGKLIIQ